MGQKTHPIGLRILKWENQWYSNYKTNSSKLIYQVYNIKYLLLFFFYKKEFLVHSFSSKYIDNFFYLTINIVPIYRNYNYSIVNSIKYYNKKLILKKNKLINLFIKNFNIQTNIKIFNKFFFFKELLHKNSYKSSSLFYNNSIPFLKKIKEDLFLKKLKKNFKKIKKFNIQRYNLKNLRKNKIKLSKLNSLISLKNFKSISNSLLKFQKFSNCTVNIQNITKSYYLSNSLSQKIILHYRFYSWMYYFYIIYKLSPSSLLISYIIKKFLETRSLRKKQRFFLKNLKRYLNHYKKYILSKRIKGIRIHVKGRINKKNRSHIYKIQLGSIPLSTISQKILYTFCPAFTIYGSFGIKVWIA